MSTADRELQRADANVELKAHLATDEVIRLAARNHWAVLLPAYAIAGAVTLGSIWLLLTSTPRLGSNLPRDLLVACGIAWLFVGWKVLVRNHDTLVVTDKRILRFRGIISTDVPMMRISKITDMRYQRSPLGEILGYGTVIIESAGQEQALHELAWLPDPLENYHRLCEVIFSEKHGQGSRKSRKWRERLHRARVKAAKAAHRAERRVRLSRDGVPLGGVEPGSTWADWPCPCGCPGDCPCDCGGPSDECLCDGACLPQCVCQSGRGVSAASSPVTTHDDHPAYSRAIPVARPGDTPPYIPRHRPVDPPAAARHSPSGDPLDPPEPETLYQSPDLREDPARTQSIWMDPDNR